MIAARKIGLAGLQIFAVAVIYLMLAWPASTAMQISFFTNTGQSQADLKTFGNMINTQITTDYQRNRQYVKVRLDNIAGYNIEKIYLFKCKGYSPAECIAAGRPPSVTTFDMQTSFEDTSLWYDLAYNNVASIMIYAKVNTGSAVFWTGQWTSIQYKGPTAQDFDIKSYEASNIRVELTDNIDPNDAKNYVESQNYIPGSWVEKIVFSTIEGSGVTKIDTVGGSSSGIDRQGTMIPSFFQSETAGNEISGFANDMTFVFPATSSRVANPVPVFLNSGAAPPPQQTCGNNIKEGTEQCDGTDSTACPGQCNPTTCTCPGTSPGQRALVIDSWSPKTASCGSQEKIVVNMHVQNPGDLGEFTGSPAYFYRIGGVQIDPPKISCTTQGDIYTYRCEINVADIPNCNTLGSTPRINIYFNYNTGQLTSPDMTLTLQKATPVLRFKGITSGSPYQCGLPGLTGMTAQFEVTNEPSASASVSYSINGGEFRSTSCSGKYSCKIPDDDLCTSGQENYQISFRFAYADTELTTGFNAHVSFPPPSMAVDSITPNIVDAGETTGIRAYLHVRNPSMIQYNENTDFEVKYLDRPYEALSCSLDSEGNQKKYYNCEMELDIPEGYEGYKTVDFKLRYTLNGVKTLTTSFYPLIVRAKPAPICGNNIMETGEECDNTDDEDCPDRCDKCVCGPEPPPDPVCGNNVRETGEECDGTDADQCGGKDCISGTCKCPPPDPEVTIRVTTVNTLDCNHVTSTQTVDIATAIKYPKSTQPTFSYGTEDGGAFTSLSTCTKGSYNENTKTQNYDCKIPADDLCSMGEEHFTLAIKAKYGSEEFLSNAQPMFMVIPEPNLQVLYVTAQPFRKAATTTSAVRLYISDPNSPLAPASPVFEYSYDSKAAAQMTCTKTSTVNNRAYYSCDNVVFEVRRTYTEDQMPVIFSVKDSSMFKVMNVDITDAVDLNSPAFEIREKNPPEINGSSGDSIQLTLKGVLLQNDYVLNTDTAFTTKPGTKTSGIACTKTGMEGSNMLAECSLTLRIPTGESPGTQPGDFQLMATADDGNVIPVDVTFDYKNIERKEKLTNIRINPADIYCESSSQTATTIQLTADIENMAGDLNIIGETIRIGGVNGIDITPDSGRACSLSGTKVTCDIPLNSILDERCSQLDVDSISKDSLFVQLNIRDDTGSVSGSPTGTVDLNIHAPPLKPEIVIMDGPDKQLITCIEDSSINIEIMLDNADLLHDTDDIQWSYAINAYDPNGKITISGDQSGDDNVFCVPNTDDYGESSGYTGTHRYEYYTCHIYVKNTAFTRCPQLTVAMGDITLKARGAKGNAEKKFDISVMEDTGAFNLEAQATSPVWPKQCQVQQYDGRCYLMGGNPTNFTVTVHDIHSKPLPTGFTFSSTTAVLTGGEDELNAQVSCTQQSAQLPAGSIEYEREYFCNVILPQTVQGKPLNDTQRTSAVEVVEPPYRLGQPQVMMTFTYGNGKGVSKLEVQGLPGVTYIKRIKTSALLNWEKQLEDAKKLTDLFMSIIRKVMWVTGFCIVCYVSDVAIDGIENKIDSPEPTNPPAGTGGQVAWADNEVLMEQINDIRTIDYLSEAHTSTSGLNDFSYQPEIQEKIFFADGSKFDWGSFAVAMISLAGVIYLLVKFLDRDSALRGVLDTDPKNDLFGHFKKGATWGLSCLIARLLGEIIQRLGGGVADVIGEDVLEGTASAFGDVCGVLLKNWRILILVAQIYLDFLQLQACFENIQRQVEQAQPVGEVNAAYQGINVMQSLASCVANLEATAQKAEQLYQAVEDAAADLGGGSGGQIYTTNRGLCGPNDAAITVYFKEVRRGDKEYRFAYLVVKDGENVLAEELNRKVVPQLTEMRGGKYTGTAQLTFRQHLPDMFIDQSGRVKQGDLNGKQIWIYLENDKGKVSEKLNVGTYYNNCAGDRGSGISDSLTAIWVETGNDGNIDAEIDAIKEIKIESKAGDISVRVSKTCDMTGTVEMLTPETFNVLQKSPGIVKVKGKSKGTCTINIADTDSSTDPSQLTITIKEKPATTGTPAGVDMPSMTLSVKTVDLKAREPNFYVIISAAGGGITHFLVDSVTKDWIKTAPSKDADIATQYSQGSSIKIFLGTHPYAKDDGIVKVCGSTSVDRNNKVESTCQDINVTFEKETAPAAQPTYTSSQAPACNFASCYVTGLCKSGVCCVVKARFGDAWADSMNGNEANTAAQKYWNTNACVTKNFGTCKTARGVSMGDDCSAATSPATVTYNGKIQILTPFHNEKTDAQLLANPDFGTFVVKADGGALQFTILAIPSNEYAVYLRGSKVTSQQTINSGQQETYTVIFTGSNIVPVKIEIQNSNTPSDKKTINYGASSGATFS